jgi:hypothetical protein
MKHFFGTRDDAVKTHVWTAICVYGLMVIVSKDLGLEISLSQILQISVVGAVRGKFSADCKHCCASCTDREV